MISRILIGCWLAGTAWAAQPNVLLLCVDDLRPELKSFGAEHIHSPAMDSLANSGRAFTRHFVQAPTCGASRYSLLTGRYATSPARRSNDAFLNYAPHAADEPPSLPAQFRQHGYRTVSVGKVSHRPAGLGGPEWNDPAKPEMPGAWDVNVMPPGPWETPRKAMHGYADGVARMADGSSPAVENRPGDDTLYPDGWITGEALRQLETLAKNDQPFFLAVGIMKPHLPFACPQKYADLYRDVEFPPIPHPEKPAGLSTWHQSREFMGTYSHDGRDPRTDAGYANELLRAYAACVSFADAQVAQLLARLDELKLTDDTIVVLWGDHGWHLGEHAVWGKHTLFEESLRAPLVIRVPEMKDPGVAANQIVETTDIYPTLCDLTGVPVPQGLSGKSLRPLLEQPADSGGVAVAYQGRDETIRTPDYRLIRHGNGENPRYELYDHRADPGETRNVSADQPDVVRELTTLLDARIGGASAPLDEK